MPELRSSDLEACASAADLEAGAATVKAAAAHEHDEERLRWAFTRKVYGIIALQFCLAAAIIGVACYVRAIRLFLSSGDDPPFAGYFAVVAALFAASGLISSWLLPKHDEHCKKKHPAVNLLLLGFVTACFSFSFAVVGAAAVAPVGEVFLQATILTAAAFATLVAYTFWAPAWRYDQVLRPFAGYVSCLLVMGVVLATQVSLHLCELATSGLGFCTTVLFSALVMSDAEMRICRRSFDDNAVAAVVSLYREFIRCWCPCCLIRD